MTQELIVTARKLAKASPMKPRPADLRRAVSTAYYTLFHTLAYTCADRLIDTGLRRHKPDWRQVYRSLHHGFARSACERCVQLAVPDEIVRFGNSLSQASNQHKTAFAALVLLKQRKA